MGLFKHQIEGVEFLSGTNPAGGNSFILADEMGTGKTRQAAVAGKEKGHGNIVVCPLSSKIDWANEIKEVYPDAEVMYLSESSEYYPGGSNPWFITNYDMLNKYEEMIIRMASSGLVDGIILDEAHNIKGDSLRAKAIIGGRKKKKSGDIAKFGGIAKEMKRVWCLSGSIILNRPIELFNVLRAIGHPLGSNKSRYGERYCGGFMMYRLYDSIKKRYYTVPQKVYFSTFFKRPGISVNRMWPDYSGATHLDELRDQLKGWMLRRTKAEVLDLPPKIISIKEMDISKEWRNEYYNAFDNYIRFREENHDLKWNKDNVIAARHLTEIGKMKQVCSLAKTERIAEDIREAVGSGQKVIVFSQYTETIKTIAAMVRDLGVVTLTGEDKIEKRQQSMSGFKSDDRINVFVANIKAGGTGINLQSGSIVMFADMEWSPGINEQAEDRAHRNGQKNTVNVYYYVVKDTIEEDIIELLEKKRGMADQILSGTKKRMSSRSVESDFMRKRKWD
jgi:SWI/SNF-related matrix-associated actin-dependent regulator 1 of chromatin subfamily A